MSRIVGAWHGARAKGSQAGISYQEMVADKVKHKPGPPSKPGISAACEKGHHSQCFKKLCQCKVCKHPQVGQLEGWTQIEEPVFRSGYRGEVKVHAEHQ